MPWIDESQLIVPRGIFTLYPTEIRDEYGPKIKIYPPNYDSILDENMLIPERNKYLKITKIKYLGLNNQGEFYELEMQATWEIPSIVYRMRECMPLKGDVLVIQNESDTWNPFTQEKMKNLVDALNEFSSSNPLYPTYHLR